MKWKLVLSVLTLAHGACNSGHLLLLDTTYQPIQGATANKLEVMYDMYGSVGSTGTPNESSYNRPLVGIYE